MTTLEQPTRYHDQFHVLQPLSSPVIHVREVSSREVGVLAVAGGAGEVGAIEDHIPALFLALIV